MPPPILAVTTTTTIPAIYNPSHPLGKHAGHTRDTLSTRET